METYYYLYRITNLVNGKIYIGAHQTKNLDDGYMGSGLLIRRAIEKYGIENFEKIILQYFNDESEMFEAESRVVNEEFVSDDSTYNIKEGGNGSWTFVNASSKNLYGLNGYGHCGAQNLLPHSEVLRILKERGQYEDYVLKMSHAIKEWQKIHGNPFAGKRHTKESKAKIGAANSKNQSGSGNSQYGTMWIHNLDLKKSKRIPKDDPIPEGWKRGRKMKF